MNIEVLVSTMNRKQIKDLTKAIRINDCIIINQITKDIIPEKNVSSGNQKFFSYKEKGLSRSRNKAISNSKADICVIADDDMYYEENYEETIKNAYLKYPKADMIAFVVDDENVLRRKKVMREGKLSLLKSMKLQSVQLTFRRSAIVSKKLLFDENFGAGSRFPWGEENIFLFDAKRKKINIYYIPIKIATLKDTGVSSWDRTNSIEHYNNQGVIFYRMSKKLYLLLIIQFVFRKRKIYFKDLSSFQVFQAMLDGVNKYKRGLL